jgi:hypothetical protein
VRKSLPVTMFTDPERSRLTMLRTWVLDNEVTEIEMKEQQFWNFAQLQPIAEIAARPFMPNVAIQSSLVGLRAGAAILMTTPKRKAS